MRDLVHPKENVYFAVALAVSLLIYLVLAVSIVGLVYVGFGLLFALFSQGLLTGHIRGNGVRVSERQFPEVHRIARDLCRKMALEREPAIYVLQEGGMLNAFAARFLSFNYVVIFSDVLELAYERGEAELAFVVCHELAHLKRKHVQWGWMLFPSRLVPFLGTAYSRACEYTCDRFGARFVPSGAVGGLQVLAAGKKLYRQLDTEDICEQASSEGGFWVWLAEKVSDHPSIGKRIRAARQMTQEQAAPAPAWPAAA